MCEMGEYEKWSLSEPRFLSMRGLAKTDFERLLPYFESAHDRYLSRREMSGKIKNHLAAL
jgi:hypothetical protein